MAKTKKSRPEKRSGFSHSLLIVQVPLVFRIWPKKPRTGWSSYVIGTPWTKICFHYMGRQYLSTLLYPMDVEKALMNWNPFLFTQFLSLFRVFPGREELTNRA